MELFDTFITFLFQSDFITTELTRLTETWFNQLGMVGLASILEIARQPFPDVKAAALLILLNIANQKWGQIKIRDTQSKTCFFSFWYVLLVICSLLYIP